MKDEGTGIVFYAEAENNVAVAITNNTIIVTYKIDDIFYRHIGLSSIVKAPPIGKQEYVIIYNVIDRFKTDSHESLHIKLIELYAEYLI